MIELYSYVDESGIQGDADYCLMVGAVGSPRQWKQFKKDWGKVLKDYNVPVFHSKDFFQPQARRHLRYYSKWSDDTCRDFVYDLTDAFNKRSIGVVGAAVNVKAFMGLPEHARRHLTGAPYRTQWRKGVLRTDLAITGAPDRPHSVAFRVYLDKVLQHLAPETKVHFWFDRQTLYEAHALDQFGQLASFHIQQGVHQNRLGHIAFEGKEEEIALQVADLNAYLWNSFVTTGGAPSGLRADVLGRLQKNTYRLTIIEKEHLDEWLQINSEKMMQDAWERLLNL